MFDFTPCKYNRIAVSYLSVTFDRAIKLTRISDFVVVKMKNGDQWTPFKNSEMVDNRTFRASNSYRFEIDDEIAECHLRPSLGEPYEIIDMEQGYVNFDQIYHIYHIKCKPVSEARRIIIEKLMDNCQELLNELKVEQKKEILKWPLLTYTFAILELEPIKMFSTILTNLEELATNVDPQRCEMYEEMVMNLRINEKLRQKIDNVQRIDILFRKVDGHFVGKMKLDNLGLKSIDHLKYLSSFITRLDLTGNKLTNLCIFEPFRRLTHLRLFNNPITSFKGISMLPQLDYLSVIEMAMNDLDIKDDFALKKIRMLEFEESGQSVKIIVSLQLLKDQRQLSQILSSMLLEIQVIFELVFSGIYRVRKWFLCLSAKWITLNCDNRLQNGSDNINKSITFETEATNRLSRHWTALKTSNTQIMIMKLF
uniref:Leucine Rich Repeat family protein n=1 Tax=Wuchereria bancrofti TaxID=6293 RepID=A0A1I8F034_WUCBA